MSIFQDILQADIDIFLNPEEFGELMEIDGRRLPVLVDNEKLAELKNKAQYADQIRTADMLLYLRTADLGYIPAQKAHIRVGSDRRIKRVSLVTETDGLLELILEENR